MVRRLNYSSPLYIYFYPLVPPISADKAVPVCVCLILFRTDMPVAPEGRVLCLLRRRNPWREREKGCEFSLSVPECVQYKLNPAYIKIYTVPATVIDTLSRMC